MRRIRDLSLWLVYPRAPWLHSFVFFEIRRRAIAFVAFVTAKQFQRLPSAVFRFSDGFEATDRRPMVSVIVPCYNHSKYLGQRLQSIARQTYANVEYILLDDGSSDDSVHMLEAFAREHADRSRTRFNAQNSGSPFAQWRTGIQMAQGELIWVAESDDFCEPDFLERLVPLFADEAVMLAFSRTHFVDPSGTKKVWSMEQYLPELDPRTWESPFKLSAQRLVESLWGRRNIIPNVSSVLFRRPSRLDLLDDPEWSRMRVCGDWQLYLRLAEGGLIAYTPITTSYFRQHQDNASVAVRNEPTYVAEHITVAEHVVREYRLDPSMTDGVRDEIQRRWQQHHREPLPGHLERRLAALAADGESGPQPRPHLLMAVYSLIPGGGEILPLRLANLLKERGHVITVLDFGQRAGQPGVRRILRSDIPLLRLSSLADLPAIVSDLAIDVIHSHHAWVDVTVAEMLSRLDGVHQVVTSHGMYDTMSATELRRLGERLAGSVAEMTYVADKNRPALLTLGLDAVRLTKVPNATDHAVFKARDRADLGISPDAFVVCVASRGIREKGWQEAIEAVRMAQAHTQRQIHLLICGEGGELHRLEPQAAGDRIHFLGFQPQPSELYAASDLGILPTFYAGESQPLTLIECLAAGKPFLATDVGEIAAMLTTPRGTAGFVVPLSNGRPDPERFAERILAYVQDPGLQRTHASIAREAYRAFRPEAMVEAYEAVYARAMGRSA